MSGKRSKQIRRAVSKLTTRMVIETWNNLCDDPWPRRVKMAVKLALGRKAGVK